MHGFTAGIAKRLRALEIRLGTIPTTETTAETNRRLELIRAALSGHEPEDLRDDERAVFSKILRYAPIALELQADLDEDLQREDDDDHEDGDDDGELVWRP
ncbi:MAG: hypothetical protein M3R38_26585 [Actinomycetota bacterium]|nr:hypothetical protein [Actinomycetota bacterium]